MVASSNARPRIDGRRQRSERTRLSIINAYMALLLEHRDIPTAGQIAARAGVSQRSVFERFDDLQSLSLATMDHAFAIGETQAAARHVDSDRATRIQSHVETRANICERWLPLWRVAVANQERLQALKGRIRFVRQVVIKRIELMYGPELSSVDETDRRDLVMALDALIDFDSWGRLREFHGLTVDQACGVWIRTIDRLLPPTPGDHPERP